ncbi:5'-methylthioadenosine/S-adenosylhomocysteine nucleosidase family protein [Winogradskya humida]|uniref:Nucleoside phosphorylase domain-containing protein n=1 Tax=Winogradskya humida TaxID=113566 RepID=A0ABQ3ZTB7_9ACTN|nr:hypothetical protein Ahu01nite_049430 [Actinoplanes humidus]
MNPAEDGQVPWALCRAAARSVRDTEFGREAEAVVRPRSTLGVFRTRGPLSLLIYVAARDGRLVWRGPGSFALLQPPADARRRSPSPGLRQAVLRRVVRSWDLFLFCAPIAVLFAVAAVCAVLFRATGQRWLITAGLLVTVAVLSYVLIMLSCLVVWGSLWFFREFGRRARGSGPIAAELLPGTRWTLAFCHHLDAGRPEPLLRLVQQRLDRLLRAELERVAADTGVRVKDVQTTESLVCLRRGVTTGLMRAAVAAWSDRGHLFAADSDVTVLLSDHRPVRAPIRIFDRGGFLFWYLSAEIAMVALLSRDVPRWERAVCATRCDGHPVTYWDAFTWLAQRLLFTDPYGLGPASRQSWVIGWLVSLMSLTGLLVTVAAINQYTRIRRIEMNSLAEGFKIVHDHTRTLIMVATGDEYEAVVRAVGAVSDVTPRPIVLPHQVVTELGAVGRTKLMLAQVEPGTVSPGAASIAAAALVTTLDLDFLILTGICYGLRPGEQEAGDILVSTQLRAIDDRKEIDPAGTGQPPLPREGAEVARILETTEPPPGPRTVLIRGDQVTPSTALLARMREVARGYGKSPRVHFGPMLSAGTLVNSRSLRDELRALAPDAVGGEMEGAGVYAASAHAKVDWIVVKAVCDWGFGKTDDFHELAAANAATFVVRAAEQGLLDDAPARGTI